MKIDELDEFQGLTREMVDHYLNRTGWCNMPDPDIRLLKPQYAHVSLKMGLSAAVERIASIEGRSVQALLREINPRMRKGWPSDEALSAHPFWLLNNAPIHCLPSVVTSSFVREKMHRSDPEFADVAPHYAWPCDEHGNKVRWPTDAEGKML